MERIVTNPHLLPQIFCLDTALLERHKNLTFCMSLHIGFLVLCFIVACLHCQTCPIEIFAASSLSGIVSSTIMSTYDSRCFTVRTNFSSKYKKNACSTKLAFLFGVAQEATREKSVTFHFSTQI